MSAARKISDEVASAPAPTILVVEDEVLIRLAVADYLRDCGFRIVEAGSADEALLVLRAEIEIDVVFSDVNMPGSMDGFGLAQWIRGERPGLKVILTSGVMRKTKAAGDLCESGPILAKPYDHGGLERRIRELLAH